MFFELSGFPIDIGKISSNMLCIHDLSNLEPVKPVIQ